MKKIIIVMLLLSVMSFPSFATEYSWKAPKVTESLLLDLTQLSSGKLVAVGERGHIIWSDDNGKNWQQAIVPTRSTLTGLSFVDDKRGWAVGHDSVIVSTTDGGENWSLQFIDIEREQPLFDVKFTDALHGIAVGAYGLYLETSDGGNSWKDIYLESLDDPDFGLPHFYQLKLLTSGEIIMVGEAGMIAIKNNSESPWQRQSVAYTGSFFTVRELDENVILAAGLRGNVFRSSDKGLNWSKIDSHTISSVFNIQLSENKKIVTLVGAEGSILFSFDNALHFRNFRREDRFGMSAMYFIDEQQAITVGEKGISDISSFIAQARQ